MRFLKAWLLFLMAAGLVSAQPVPEPKPTVVVLHPQAAPVPALQYPLLPDVTDLHSGNAALYYHRAMLLRCLRRPQAKELEQIEQWLNMPLQNLPLPQVRKLVNDYGSVLHEVDFAARCRSLDWGLRERKEGISLLMPEVQEMRSLIQIVALQARLEMAERHFGKAVLAFQTGYAMSRQVGQNAGTLVETLVAMALAGVMDKQLEQYVQLPRAPNLYWSLAQLPRPLIPLRPGLEGDKSWFWDSFPALRRLETETLTASEVNRIVFSTFPEFASVGLKEPSIHLVITALTIKSYPVAKEWLKTRGKTQAEIQAMPALQAVLLYSIFQYHRLQDETYKWAYLPYWQADAGGQKAEQELKKAKATLSEGIPFASLFLPAIQRIEFALAPLERRQAALRIVEAVRMYTAGHHGQLPDTLDAITEVPIPIDPVTGESFEYRRTNNTALLTSRAGAHPFYVRSTLMYELQIAENGALPGGK